MKTVLQQNELYTGTKNDLLTMANDSGKSQK